MADEIKAKDFTVFLEGHEGHQGNVLGHAYITKLSKLLIILGRMERAYLGVSNRRTDFEIVGAEKYNPTTLTLKPVPKAKNYNPAPSFQWCLEQIELIGTGGDVDKKINSQIAKDLADISQESSDKSYRRFWINGHADKISFDDSYHINALRLTKKLVEEESAVAWFVGQSQGEVVGRLKKLDTLDAENEFVIVPPVGAERIICKFPESMKPDIANFVFKMVRVSGTLFYSDLSPHPYKIITQESGVTLVKTKEGKKKLRDMRGIFKGAVKKQFKLEDAF